MHVPCGKLQTECLTLQLRSAGSRRLARGAQSAIDISAPWTRNPDPWPARTGGEVLAAADTAATAAAREAESGAWLAELEADALPRISAPGLPCGLFGAWAEPDLPDGASGEPIDEISSKPPQDWCAAGGHRPMPAAV